MGQSRYIKHC